jgi:hypothetical protein
MIRPLKTSLDGEAAICSRELKKEWASKILDQVLEKYAFSQYLHFDEILTVIC